VQARHRGILAPDIELVFDHHGVVLVRALLTDPDAFVGETLCDPMEGPSYGYGKALVMHSQRAPGRIFIHSFAHGGATYDLRHDIHSARAVLAAAPEADQANTLCAVVDASDLEPDEVQQLIDFAAARGKLKLRPLAKRLKEDQANRERRRRQEAAADRLASASFDQRLRLPLPAADAEIPPVLAAIDRRLSEDASDSPPMRRPDGTLVEVRVAVPLDLHLLAATGSNRETDADSEALPAPAEPLLFAMTATGVERMITRHIAWEKSDRDGGYLYDAQTPAVFVRAFMELAGSESMLPQVRGINTAPMVAMNGAIIDGIGLDRDSGLYHQIEPALRDCLPRDEITAADVREAVAWLCDEWLVDVLTNQQGKLVTISGALSVIERHLLETRPANLVTAGQRGGGKTTLIHMISMAVTGRMAPAASWSESQEERRKALFSYFRQGVAMVVWDNIKNGAEIACPEVEKSLTSPAVSDRVLSVSRTETAASTTIQFFVGNNVRFGGDMASRGPEIRLMTDDPWPENRTVVHPDPIGWTRNNRGKILRCLYTILLYGCRNRPPEQVAKTRFKTWWSLCGWPVELAATLLDPPEDFDFTAIFKATEAQDTKAAATIHALRVLRQKFGSVEQGGDPDAAWFRSAQLREPIEALERARGELRFAQHDTKVLRDARDFLALLGELHGKPVRDPITSVIGRLLGSIVDRPVELGATTVGVLKSKTTHGNNQWFRVETHSSGRSDISKIPAADNSENTQNAPPPLHARPEQGVEDVAGRGGGASGADLDCSEPKISNYREAPPPPDHFGSPQPTDEELSETESLVLDIETFSTVDLKRVGLHYYVAHPDTDVSVACYAFGATGTVQTWLPGQSVPDAILRHVAAGGRMVAHNFSFEVEILRRILGPRHGWPVPAQEQWTCTMARAACHAFPASLDGLSEALPLKARKNQAGHALMLRMARPRGFDADGKPRWWHVEEPTRLADGLAPYCGDDVRAEQEANYRLPELPAREQLIWRLDAAINDRGITIDVAGADALARATTAELACLNAEMAKVSGGAVAAVTNVSALKSWLIGRGHEVESLDKEHMAHVLRRTAVQADPDALRALQLRRDGSLASTAKLKPMLGTLGSDHRARGLFVYYGSRTGRWAGRRIQPQNLVRGHKDAGDIIDALVGGADLHALAAAHDCCPLELIAGCLRGLFIAPVGHRLVCVDLAQIEARTLAWLAGQEDALQIYAAHDADPTAPEMYAVEAARHNSDNRNFGKVLTLALGFQMGALRFVETARQYGIILTEEEGAQHVAQWRDDHPMIVGLWRMMNDAVMSVACGGVGDELEVGRCRIIRRPNAVRIRLPSGRDLIYHAMGVVARTTGWEGPELAFMGVDQLTHQWCQQRTYGGRLVENITQAVARDVLAELMLTLHGRGHRIVGSVHDEVLLETGAEQAEALLDETLASARTPPDWAAGLPVNAEGFVSPRYRKG
jgi:hypothetical protein